MKLLINLFLSISLLSTQAMAATHEGIKDIYDDLNYSLTVEWDQKDKVFYADKIAQFQNKLLELKNQGIQNEEILSFALDTAKDEKLVHDIREAISVLGDGNIANLEGKEIINSISGKFYSSGASWNGRTTVVASAATVVLVVAIILATDFNSNRK